MSTRILFNGREYGDPSEMPDDVRRDYEQALAQFEDANRNGIPDVLENAGKNVIVVHQSSFSLNGKTFDGVGDLPPWARQLYEHAMGNAPATGGEAHHAQKAASLQPSAFASRSEETSDDLDSIESIDTLDATRNILTTLVRVLLVLSAIGVVIVTPMMFVGISESEKSQGGRVWIVVGGMLLLGVIIDRYIKISKR
jgi:hypothetical protein